MFVDLLSLGLRVGDVRREKADLGGTNPRRSFGALKSSLCQSRFFSLPVPLHRHIGRRKASPCYFSSPRLLRRAVDRSGHRERGFCFDDRRLSVSFAHAAHPG